MTRQYTFKTFAQHRSLGGGCRGFELRFSDSQEIQSSLLSTKFDTHEERFADTEGGQRRIIDVQLAAVQEASLVRIRDEDGIPLLLL